MQTTAAPIATEFCRIGSWTVFEDDSHDDGDTRKLRWFAVHEDTGDTRDFDLSPYRRPSMSTLSRMIDLGFPTGAEMARPVLAPLTPDDVDALWHRAASAA